MRTLLFPLDKELKPFQVEAVERMITFLEKDGAVYNACEMGLGKTIQTIVAVNTIRNVLNLHKKTPDKRVPGQTGSTDKTLIICPAVMRLTWLDELKEWNLFTDKYLVALKTSDLSHVEDYDTVIISYDLVSKTKPLNILREIPFDFLIMDEAHRLKTPSALRTIAVLKHIYPNCRYKIALSGTPFTKSIVDGYTLFSRMLPSTFKNYYDFANRYAYRRETPWGVQYHGVKNAEELSKLIRDNFYIRYTKKEVLPELPDKTYSRITLPKDYVYKPSDEEKGEVEEAEKKLRYGYQIKETQNLAKFRRLQAEKKIVPICEFTIDFLENDIPIVLFAYHVNVIEALYRKLIKYNPVVIMGSTFPEERYKAVKDFQEGKTNLIILNLKAGGEGITLTRSSNVIMAEIDYSPAVIDQASARVHRIGTKNPVTIYYFVVAESLEVGIVNTVIAKARTFSKVVEN